MKQEVIVNGDTATVTQTRGFLSGAGKALHSRESQISAAAFLLFDVVSFAGLFFLIAWFRIPHIFQNPSFYFLLLPCLATIFFLYLIDGYNLENDLISAGYASQHALAVVFAAAATLFASFVLVQNTPLINSRVTVLLSFAAFNPLSLYYRRLIHARFRQRMDQRVVLFIGSLEAARKFHKDYAGKRRTSNLIYTTCDESECGEVSGKIVDNASGASLPAVLSRHLNQEFFQNFRDPVSAVVVADDPAQYPTDLLAKLVDLRFQQVPVFSLASFYEAKFHKIPSTEISHHWLLQKGFNIAHDPVYLHVKRLSDLLLSGTGLLVTAPLFLLVAAVIKATDRGPVFFRQQRIGKDKQPFTVLKFRTMREGSEKGDLYTQKGDNRVTPVGRWLRRWRLDELPQLWNVVRGDMSLIGPRAEWDKLVAEYEKQIPCYHFRHLVKPGITGWAQVNYPYGANLEDTIHKLEYDLYYLRHFSILLDGSIIIKTINTMIFAKGQ